MSAVRVRHRPLGRQITDDGERKSRSVCVLSSVVCPASSVLHRFLEFLGRPEGDFLAYLDLKRLAGGGVSAHAGGALAHLKNAETADANAVALLEVLSYQAY